MAALPWENTDLTAQPRRMPRRCLRCKQVVYRVRNAEGVEFDVTHTGKVNCPVLSHGPGKRSVKRKRRGKR